MAKILVIDDDKLVRDLYVKLFASLGHEGVSASTLKEGMEILRTGNFDLVLLDVYLPDGNGLEAIPTVKGNPSQPEFIIITAMGARDGAELAIRSGAWDYIEKPSPLDELTLTVLRALQYREEKGKNPFPGSGFGKE